MIPKTLPEQEEHLFAVLSGRRFLQMEGLSNEVPFFIYPYPPEDALAVAGAKKRIKNRLSNAGVRVFEVNLYDLSVDLLKEQGDWDELLEVEPSLDKSDFTEMLQSMLNPQLRLAPAIRDRLAQVDFGLAQIEARADATVRGITDYPAWPALNTQLQRLVLDGIDADQVLRDEAMIVRRDPSRDLAAIVASRIDGRQRATGPLPWLPPVPRQVTEDDFWGRYFDRRHELIERHGTAVRAAATSWTPATAPAWAVPTLSDPSLTRDLATWRAAHDIPDTDLRPTGPPANDRAGSYLQRRLDLRIAEAGGPQTALEPAAARLAETIHPGITADPHWPTLAHHIAAADQAGIGHAELQRIATGRPLPIEQPAAALAYRLTDAIGERPVPAPVKAPEPVPPRPYEPRQPRKPAAPRPYEPPRLPTPPPEHVRTPGRAPNIQAGPRR